MEGVLPGVFVVVHDLGVLVTGPPGSGKSTLALELVARGHALVADDSPLFRPVEGRLMGRAGSAVAGFLHVRGLGAFDLRRQYGAGAVRDSHSLGLIVAPAPAGREEAGTLGLPVAREERLGVAVAVVRPDTAVLARPALMEALVMRHRLALEGHDAAAALARRQREALSGPG